MLETPEAIRKGGESGPAVVPGKGMESLLLQVSARLEKPFMPPKNNKVGANPLTPQELGLLKLWIDQGAKGGGDRLAGAGPAAAAKVEYQPLPEGLNPIYAVAVTDDGAARRVQPGQPDFRLQPAEAAAPDASHRPRPARHRRRGPAGRRPPRPRPEPRVQPRRQAARVRRLPRGEALAAARPGRAVHAAGRRDEARRRRRHEPRRQGRSPSAATRASIRLFDLPTASPCAELKGHAGEVTVAAVFRRTAQRLFTGVGRQVACACGTWPTRSRSAQIDTPHPVAAMLVLEPKDAAGQVITAGGDNAIRVWAMPGAQRAACGNSRVMRRR